MSSNELKVKSKGNSRVNSLWLMMEKTISIAGLFLVSAFVAKYIGPTMVGVIALAVTSFQIVQVIALFGSEHIIIRRLSKKPHSGIALMRASMIMRATIFIIVSLPILWFSHRTDFIEFVFCSAIAVATFFTTIDLYATYNDTTLNSQINVRFNLCGLLVALIARYIIVEFKINILWLTLPIIATTMLPLALRTLQFHKKRSIINYKKNKHTSVYLKYLILTGGSMLIANIAVAVYPRMNIFFLSQMSDAETLGIYSVAVTLATSWSFIVQAVITSYFPAIYNERVEHQAMLKAARLNVFILLVSLCAIAGFALLGKYLIVMLYGPMFASVWLPGLILCAGTMLSTLGTVSSRFIIKYSGYQYLTYKSLMTLVLCIPVSWCLIHLWGLEGAACSVVFMELMSLTLLNYGFQRGKVMKMHLCLFSLKPIYIHQ